MPVLSLLLWFATAVLLGVLVAGIGSRVRFARTATPGVAEASFRCKARFPCHHDQPWPRRRTRARWVHDVLLVRQGFLFPHAIALPVRGAERAVRHTSTLELGGLGPRPVVLALRLDDGEEAEVAARAKDLVTLAGPFLTAAIPGLPQAPIEPGRRPAFPDEGP